MSFLTRQMTSKVPRLATRAFSTSRSSQLARITVIGRVGTDPETIESTKGVTVVKYVVGSSSGPKDKQETSWFKISAFPKSDTQRDFYNSLTKGTLVYLEGDAAIRPYVDSEGTKRSSLNIVQSKVQILQRSNSTEDDGGIETIS